MSDAVDPAALEAVKARQRLTWGLDVEAYVKHTATELGPVSERMIEIADPAWASSALDLGCGPGTATFPLARRVGPGGRVVGIDLAPPMVAWAERAAEKQSLTNVTFEVGDAEDLSVFADGSFALVISNFGIIFAPSPEKVVSEAARVLAPGGAFVFSLWRPIGIVKETFEIMASITPPPPPGVRPPESWGEPGEAERRLGAAFGPAQVEEVQVQCSYASVDQAWQRMKEGRPPFALAYQRLDAEGRAAIEERVRALYRKYADATTGQVRYERSAAIVKAIKA
jgi:SAM-dependent methyltransferase